MPLVLLNKAIEGRRHAKRVSPAFVRMQGFFIGRRDQGQEGRTCLTGFYHFLPEKMPK